MRRLHLAAAMNDFHMIFYVNLGEFIPAKLFSNQVPRIMSYPRALYIAPPSTALLSSKIQAVVFAGPELGEPSSHGVPEENNARPEIDAKDLAERGKKNGWV